MTRRIEGYAIVCAAGCIADASGDMPPELSHEGEWAWFQSELDASDVIVLGRVSHLAVPNVKRRRRLVLTRSVDTQVQCDGVTWLWNPAGCGFEAVLEAMGGPAGRIAVAGGRGAFGHFLGGPDRFTAFHLSHLAGVRLEGGVALFPEGGPPEAQDAGARLHAAGYQKAETRRFDERAHVDTWRPWQEVVER